MALMAAIVGYAHLITDAENKTVTGLMTTLLDQPYTARQATYDLRRLRRKGLIERRPHSHRYLPRPTGRVLASGLAAGSTSPEGRKLTRSETSFQPS
jgi:hypothetical protein